MSQPFKTQSFENLLQQVGQALLRFGGQLRRFPWRAAVMMLVERYREDRLGQTASSLTFTTLLALVPFVTVALALFTAFPIFAEMQGVLQSWLMESLIPESIGGPVLSYLTQFSAKAGGLGAVGFSFLMVTALMLILTMDRTLNAIWRVQRLRPLGQRVLIYWAAITLGPLVLGAGLALTTSVATAASHSLRGTLPGGVRVLFGSIEFMVLASAMTALYRYVPNTLVQWRHAWAGGGFVALGMTLAKKGLGLYLASVPTYSVIYGTFATLPILLMWIYISWILVLLGAVVAAYLPGVLDGIDRAQGGQGASFEQAVQALGLLQQARQQDQYGLTASQLAHQLRMDTVQLPPVLDAFLALGWVVQLNEGAAGAPTSTEPRYVLLAEPQTTFMEPLVQRLLVQRSTALEGFWSHTGMEMLKLSDVLATPATPAVVPHSLRHPEPPRYPRRGPAASTKIDPV